MDQPLESPTNPKLGPRRKPTKDRVPGRDLNQSSPIRGQPIEGIPVYYLAPKHSAHARQNVA